MELGSLAFLKKLRWVREVKKTRDKWKGPSQHSVVCSAHFTEDSFESGTVLESQFGLLKRRFWLQPSEKAEARCSCDDSEVPAPKRRRERERSRESFWHS